MLDVPIDLHEKVCPMVSFLGSQLHQSSSGDCILCFVRGVTNAAETQESLVQLGCTPGSSSPARIKVSTSFVQATANTTSSTPSSSWITTFTSSK